MTPLLWLAAGIALTLAAQWAVRMVRGRGDDPGGWDE